ncbi:MAG: hypothetical protein ACOX4F_04270 [Atopobiaceae bacterium]
MVMLTYQMPDEIRKVALGGEYNGFDLNAFFEARGEGDDAEFVLKDSVQKWLDLIRGCLQALDRGRPQARRREARAPVLRHEAAAACSTTRCGTCRA